MYIFENEEAARTGLEFVGHYCFEEVRRVEESYYCVPYNRLGTLVLYLCLHIKRGVKLLVSKIYREGGRRSESCLFRKLPLLRGRVGNKYLPAPLHKSGYQALEGFIVDGSAALLRILIA